MFWIVAAVALVGALGWLLAARARAPGSLLWSIVHELAIGFVRLFGLHVVAGLAWVGMSLAEIRSAGPLALGIRLLVIGATLAIVIYTPFAVDRRASSLGAAPVRSLSLAGCSLIGVASVGYFMCLPYMLD